jgi:predicted enzyme related to lactoylglutathione lyase
MAEQPAANTFCWNELSTSDASACARFYTGLFGWTAETRTFGPTQYTVFKKEGHDMGGMLQMTPEWAGIRPHWMAYVAVDDVDGCAQKIPELGGKVCIPPTDIPVGRFAVVEDPTGAVFSIIKLAG